MTTRRDFMKMGALLTLGGVTGMGMTGVANALQPVSRTGGPVLKVGCAAYSYRKYLTGENKTMDLFDFLETAAEVGCDSVELTSYYFPGDVNREYINNIKRRAFLLGLEVSSTSVGNRFTFPQGDERKAQVDSVKKWIYHAAEMGAPCIRIFAGGAPSGTSEEEAIKWVAESIHECLDTAIECGVMLGLENHGGVTANAGQVISIMEGADSDWVGVLLDTGNFRTEDPYEDMARVAPYAISTHYKVYVRPAGQDNQSADLNRIVQILGDAGFRGHLVLEYEAAEDPKTAIPRIIAEMRESIK